MRKRFEQQLSIGQLPIEETQISPKAKNALNELLAALHSIYCNKKYNEEVFSLLEKHISSGKKKTGRNGMDLWCIFVLSQVRLCLNISYGVLHDLANNHRTLRQLMGVEYEFGYQRIGFEYQNIYDNVSMLSDELIAEINSVVIKFGHKEVFKKKEDTALRLKTDSFVVESNVHFPTDYNLLWDSARKCLDTVSKFLDKYRRMKGWRKIRNWNYEMKGLMRELGKKLTITTDQYDLIVDHQLMYDEQDRDVVIELADRLLGKYRISSWSFDKGYWRKENKELLQLEVSKVVMPKLGRRNKAEEMEESSHSFKRFKNKHSAIESNINELEHRGLDRCPDRGLFHYTRYVSLGVCAYNLKKIGREILKQEKGQVAKAKPFLQKAA